MKKFNSQSFGGNIFTGIVTFIICTILANQVSPWITAQAIKYSSSFNTLVFINVSNHDLVGLQQSTHMLVTIFSVSFFILVFGASYFVMLYFRKQYEDSKARLYEFQAKVLNAGTINEKDIEDISSEELKQKIEDSIKADEKNDKYFSKLYLVAKYLLPISIILNIYNATYTTLTNKYVYESISYFDYLLKVNAVSLDDKTERTYMTRFTQIRSSQDYKDIVLELENLAFSRGLSITPSSTVRPAADIRKDHPKVKAIEANANEE